MILLMINMSIKAIKILWEIQIVAKVRCKNMFFDCSE
mgnify:CR=1 FL=1